MQKTSTEPSACGRRALLAAIIRRNRPKPSMIRGSPHRGAVVEAAHAVGKTARGLESDKKTHQVAALNLTGLGRGARGFPGPPFWLQRPTRSGHAIDHGPRNEAPRDADRGAARRCADRPDRD